MINAYIDRLRLISHLLARDSSAWCRFYSHTHQKFILKRWKCGFNWYLFQLSHATNRIKIEWKSLYAFEFSLFYFTAARPYTLERIEQNFQQKSFLKWKLNFFVLFFSIFIFVDRDNKMLSKVKKTVCTIFTCVKFVRVPENKWISLGRGFGGGMMYN